MNIIFNALHEEFHRQIRKHTKSKSKKKQLFPFGNSC